MSAQAAPEWRSLPGYEGYYEVSSAGDVRSLNRVVIRSDGHRRTIPSKVLTKKLARNGYYYVSLCRGAVHQTRPIHRLVLEAFIGPRPPKLLCCHNDGNKLNNHIENLRWDTAKSNGLDTVLHGNNRQANQTHCKRGHLFDDENTWYDTKNNNRRTCRACCKRRSNRTTKYEIQGQYPSYTVTVDGEEINRAPDMRSLMLWFNHMLHPGDTIHWVADDEDEPQEARD